VFISTLLAVGFAHAQQPGLGAGVVPRFENVTATNLPAGILQTRSMDARPADIDADGDLDLVIATEFGPNYILLNDGHGVFTNGSPALLPQPQPVHDSEDVAIADFNMDGHLDILFVAEDDQINELYYWDADAGKFELVTGLLGVSGVSNACLAADIDDDGDPDILIGNAGFEVVLINNGDGTFENESALRMALVNDITQDLELGDVDGDGDLDLVIGNESNNRLLINDGRGFFTDESAARLGPMTPGKEMTREADLADVDGDGDLDLLFANAIFAQGNDPQDRLLLNDGDGFFTDVTSEQLAPDSKNTIDGDFIDMDADGDLDIVQCSFNSGGVDVLQNDGTGHFVRRTPIYLPLLAQSIMDAEGADFNGDGVLDIYLCHYLSKDQLFFGTR
jgi:hypothetical protein